MSSMIPIVRAIRMMMRKTMAMPHDAYCTMMMLMVMLMMTRLISALVSFYSVLCFIVVLSVSYFDSDVDSCMEGGTY